MDRRLKVSPEDLVHGASREHLMREIARLRSVVSSIGLSDGPLSSLSSNVPPGGRSKGKGAEGAGGGERALRVRVPDAAELDSMYSAASELMRCAEVDWEAALRELRRDEMARRRAAVGTAEVETQVREEMGWMKIQVREESGLYVE